MSSLSRSVYVRDEKGPRGGPLQGSRLVSPDGPSERDVDLGAISQSFDRCSTEDSGSLFYQFTFSMFSLEGGRRKRRPRGTITKRGEGGMKKERK